MAALLRAVRRQHGLTLEKLAERTGLTKSYLSKIERRRSTPSIATAMLVAQALNVDVAQLFSDQNEAAKIVVDRAAGRVTDRQRYRAVAAELLGKSMSPFIVQPGRTDRSDHHPSHSGQEFVFVHAGAVELTHGDQTMLLEADDSAYFDASVFHRIRTVGTEPANVVVVAVDDPGGPR